jgi:hypothetical protein
MKTLQTLWSVYSHRFDCPDGDPRAARLEWASQHLGRSIDSFRDLTGFEAARLIDALKLAVGQEVNVPRKPPRDRQSAIARGTHGRKGRVIPIAVLATPDDLSEISALRERVGLTQEQFEAWLGSRRSPTHRRRVLRTVADCNRVRWALKAMLRRAG